MGLVGVLWLMPGAATAEDADSLVEQGIELREARRDEEALVKFQRAHALAPTPRTRAQIALAEQALGRWAAAEADLVAALGATSDPWILRQRAALEGALSTIRAHLGDLVLSGGAESAEVVVDGARLAVLPLAGPLRLEVGTHALEVTRPGFFPVSRPITIQADVPVRVALDMRPRLNAMAEGMPVGVSAGVPIAGRVPVAPVRTAPSSLGFTVAGLGVGLAGLGLVGLGAAGLVARAGQVSAYNDDASCPPIDAATKPAACQARVDSARTWEVVGAVGLAGGVVLVLAGTAVVLLGSLAGGGRTALLCSPSPAGVLCAGRF